MLGPLIAISPIDVLAVLDVLADAGLGVDQLHLDAGDRLADGADARGLAPDGEAGDRRGLGEAVALEDRDAEAALELLVHLDRQRGAAGRGDPQRSGELLHVDAGVVERAEQAPVHRRDAGEEGDVLAASISASAGPASKRGSSTTVPPKAKPAFMITVWPKEWNSGSTHSSVSGLSASAPKSASLASALRDHVAVHQLGALGLAGGAGGVEDDGGVVVVDVDASRTTGACPLSAWPSVSAPSIGRLGGRVGGDHEEVLARRRSARSRRGPRRRSAARACPGSRSTPSRPSRRGGRRPRGP